MVVTAAGLFLEVIKSKVFPGELNSENVSWRPARKGTASGCGHRVEGTHEQQVAQIDMCRSWVAMRSYTVDSHMLAQRVRQSNR